MRNSKHCASAILFLHTPSSQFFVLVWFCLFCFVFGIKREKEKGSK